MPVIQEGRTYKPTKRLSTTGGASVSWTDPTAGADDYSSLLGNSYDMASLLDQYTPTYTQPKTADFGTGGLSLGKLGLGLAGKDNWLSAYTPGPTLDEYTPAEINKAASASTYKGGGGAKAYGWNGATGTAGTKGSGPYGFQPEMWAALVKANTAMAAAGLGNFSITDGWRSYDAQVDVKKRKPNYAATPGRSIHGLGYAADLKLTKAQQQWLYANGAKYGLYFGAGYSKEPWHLQLMSSLARPPWAKK